MVHLVLNEKKTLCTIILKSRIENKKEGNYIKNYKNQIIWHFVNRVFSAKAKKQTPSINLLKS